MIDDKFIETFIEIAEKVSPQKNVYVYTFKFPGKYVKHHKGLVAPYGSEALDDVFKNLQSGDKVFIHWFDDRFVPYLEKIDYTIPIGLFLWGGDFLEQTPELIKYNFGSSTYKLVERRLRNSMFQKSMQPMKWLGMLKEYCTYHSRMKARYKWLFNNRKTFLSRLDCMYHWNVDDIRIIESAYGVSVKFQEFFYDLGLQKISPNLNHQPSGKNIIWLGNSATPTNNHLEALNLLSGFKRNAYQIIAPLSYGLKWYAKVISKKAIMLHGASFTGLMEFIPLVEYLKLIQQADVVIMNHHRSQAGANIFAFIYMGKKVYLNKKSSVYNLLTRNSIKVFDSESISHISFDTFIQPLEIDDRIQNSQKLYSLFSEEKRAFLLNTILN
ncbi:MAG: TDP-N-acetylfucosamine:lipid II N-acetylfucosaminyltransferase [Ferruginibacter sp.]|nr:TDP-N-acetylfucosamine:lipid II N-acetylfucosaminyltransferase [Ferruginibacter sp.]